MNKQNKVKKLLSWEILKWIELSIVIIFSWLFWIFLLLGWINELNRELWTFFILVLVLLIMNIIFSFIAFFYIKKMKQIGLLFALIPKFILLVILIFTPLTIVLIPFILLIAYCKYKIVDNNKKKRLKNIVLIFLSVIIIFTIINLLIKIGYIKNYLDIRILDSRNCENKICSDWFYVEKKCMMWVNNEWCCKCYKKNN